MDNEIEKPQNRFTAAQVEEMFRHQEESKFTSLYDKIYQEEQALTENRILAEEMLSLSPEVLRKERW